MSSLNTDLLCCHCHYNLRTLAPSAHCPECATPVANSIAQQHALQHFHPQRLRRGSLILTLLPLLMLPTWLFLKHQYPFFDEGAIEQFSIIILHPLLILPAMLLIFYSAPRTPHHKRNLAFCLSCIAIPIAAQLLCIANLVFPMHAPLWDDTHTQTVIAAIALAFAANTVLLLGARRFLRHYAPFSATRRLANITSVGLTLCALINLALALAELPCLAIFLYNPLLPASPTLLWYSFHSSHPLFPYLFWTQAALHSLAWSPFAFTNWKLKFSQPSPPN